MRKSVLVFAVLAVGLLWLPAIAEAAADDIPGTPMSVGDAVSGTIDQTTKPRDVYSISLKRGEQVQMTLTMSQVAAISFQGYATCLFLISPSSTSIATGKSATIVNGTVGGDKHVRTITYTPAVDGTYYIDVATNGYVDGGMHGVTYSLTTARTAAPAITDPWAPDIFGIAIGPGTVHGVIDVTTMVRNVFAVRLFASEPVQLPLTMSHEAYIAFVGHATCLHLMAPSSTSVGGGKFTNVADGQTGTDGHVRTITYTPAVDGAYFINVVANGYVDTDGGMHGVTYALTVAGSAEKPRYPTRTYLHGPASAVRRGSSVSLRTNIVDVNLHPIAGKALRLWSSRDGKTWTEVRSATSSSTANSVFKYRVRRSTYFKVRFRGDADYASSSSRRITVRVR
jgi:hypothetical protein